MCTNIENDANSGTEPGRRFQKRCRGRKIRTIIVCFELRHLFYRNTAKDLSVKVSFLLRCSSEDCIESNGYLFLDSDPPSNLILS